MAQMPATGGGESLTDLARTEVSYHQFKWMSLDGLYQYTNGASIYLDDNTVELQSDAGGGQSRIVYQPPVPVVNSDWSKRHSFRSVITSTISNGSGYVLSGMNGGNAIGFKVNSSDIYGVAQLDGSESQTAAFGATGALDGGLENYDRVRAEFHPGSKVVFYLNGSEVGSVSSNLPTGQTDSRRVWAAIDCPDQQSQMIGPTRRVTHP